MYWKLLSNKDHKIIWDYHLKKFDDYNIWQGYGWGEFERCFGWDPYRWVAYSQDGEVIALFQAFVRKIFGIGIIPLIPRIGFSKYS